VTPWPPAVSSSIVETRSALDLKKVGAFRYSADPTTDVWCAAYAIDDGPVQLWRPGDPPPPEIVDIDEVVAHNAGFERAICDNILSPRYGWSTIPIKRWHCTMAASLALALPPALAKVATVLGLPQQKANASIVALTCKPRRPRGDEDPNGGPYWFDDPEHLEPLYAYCKQDVETERALWRWLSPLIPAEQALWQLDQQINGRGFYVDGKLIADAIDIATAADDAVQAELRQLTAGEITTTNQVEKLLAWLAAHGCQVKNLQKATL